MIKTILLLIICLQASVASAFTIATGPSDGSYSQIAQDIKSVAGKENIDIQVMPTKGSLEISSSSVPAKWTWRSFSWTLYGLSPTYSNNSRLDLFDSIKVILNLYPEEIHVLSNKSDIQTFYQLEGKRVSRGYQAAAPRLPPRCSWPSMYQGDGFFDTFDDAMKKLEQGGLDAVMFVGGAPVPLSASWTVKFILSVCRPTRHSSNSTHERAWEISISLVCNRDRNLCCAGVDYGVRQEK